jgi:hypothetical protein
MRLEQSAGGIYFCTQIERMNTDNVLVSWMLQPETLTTDFLERIERILRLSSPQYRLERAVYPLNPISASVVRISQLARRS